MADPMSCYPSDRMLGLLAVADRTARMALMPVSAHLKPLPDLNPAIRHISLLADRALGMADRSLASFQDGFDPMGGEE